MSGGTNVALNKAASSSSTYKNNSKFTPAKGVDGVDTSFFHTKSGIGQWFQVDLNGSFSAESVELLNKDCASDPACACRLSGANLYLYDGAGNQVLTMKLGNTCGQTIIVQTIPQCLTKLPTNSAIKSPSSPSMNLSLLSSYTEKWYVNWSISKVSALNLALTFL
jgi:hypothetical protein